MPLTQALYVLRTTGKIISGTAAAYGLLIPLWISRWFGRIVVQGELPSKKQIKETGVLLMANHPSLIETIVLPALLSPWRWSVQDTQLPYSVADSQLFGRHSEWLYKHFRCVSVSRDELTSTKMNRQAARTCIRILAKQGLLISYPEGGRTCKGDAWEHSEHGSVRTCNPAIVKIAQRTNAQIIPVWISHGDCTQPESLLRGYYKLFFHQKMIVTFGSPVTFPTSPVTSQEVANVLLHTATPGKT
jgi:1-acyl-sn-glycerol-3-phosphate acyltransferase